MDENEQIINEEIAKLISDIIMAYEESGKKVSGEFAGGLEAQLTKTAYSYTATIKGYEYLAGRRAGKMPPVSALEKWVKEKGIFDLRKKTARSIAYAIAKKIEKEGTAREYEIKIYKQVITPERIDKIIDAVSEINVNKLLTTIRVSLGVLTKV